MVIATLEGGREQNTAKYNKPKLMQPKHECRSEKCQTTLPLRLLLLAGTKFGSLLYLAGINFSIFSYIYLIDYK